MKSHLTEKDVCDMIFEKLNIANPNIDKISDLADSIGLEYDEEEQAYINPSYRG